MPKAKALPSDKMSPGSLAKLSNHQLIAYLRKHFFGPAKRLWRDHLPYMRLAHKRFSQPGRRIPIKGRPTWTQFCKLELGVDIRTVQRWLSDKPCPKTLRQQYDAVDIAHLEKVARAAQDLAEGDPDNPDYEPIRKAIREKPDVEVTVSGITGNAVDGKHYLLTPPELRAKLEGEFGPMYDPCPYPRPKTFNGLEAEWRETNYINPPFYGEIINGKKYGMTAWVKKAIEEQALGKTSLLVFPQFGWFHMLLEAGAEMRSLGLVRWIATEDGSAQPSPHKIVMYVLRGKKLEDL